MIEITDAQIEEFESRFEGLLFDNETKEFIKCLESKDIQACPGAGKTTSLVAKLDIIASQMPFKDNSGILVLTHTNVAVDEIKAKLGANAKILLSYPNHVGTFQSFINKYLAIPMYVKLRGNRPERIDTEIFYKKFENILKTYHASVFGWLSSVGEQRRDSAIGVYQKLTINSTNDKFYYNNQGNAILTQASKQQFFNTIKTIKDRDIERELTYNGYLKYEHCYELALKYLKDFPNMKEIFQKRFKYVFVDEVQDTDDVQFEILDKLFSSSDVVIQRIGDKNQEIFSSMKLEASGWQISSNNLEIKNTKRLSTKISEKVTYFAISPQELSGNPNIQIQPTILLFDEQNINNVIREFGNLIVENELLNVGNKRFKAVGAIGKINTDGKVTIPNYFLEYSKEDNQTSEFDTLLEKLALFEQKNILPKDYQKVLLTVIIEYLKINNIKNDDKFFNITTLLKFLKENNREIYSHFKLKLFEGVQKLNAQECAFELLKEKIQLILNLFEATIDETILQNMIKTHKIEFTQKTNQNKFNYINGDIKFDIDISTIHKVKGETHTATLVLETFKSAYDLKVLLNLLKGKKRKSYDDKKKLLYVAMSRPTHLLCLAMNKEHVSDEDKSDLESCGYLIKDITTP
ncbi:MULTISPECIES: UvrD-helicase domain-containing protein [Aliarcobacter]|uniref:UvrD-helicase domain-containing protein n=1 Tax=Aliarcobacter TaxID=2321111 RepID=UPI0010FDD747|nr:MULTISPECIES: UvrD-helicase domain-containing protein [Aliarcobacter]MCT7597263.1 AAA family ATPase [Aliarcobacter butzleri]TLT03394.1 ATP-dependent helicase [Aliarcobacter cibarius]